jgi:hypothetical protein
MHAQSPRIPHIVRLPHLFDNLQPAEHLAGIAQEGQEGASLGLDGRSVALGRRSRIGSVPRSGRISRSGTLSASFFACAQLREVKGGIMNSSASRGRRRRALFTKIVGTHPRAQIALLVCNHSSLARLVQDGRWGSRPSD